MREIKDIQASLDNGAFDEALCGLYCRGISEIGPYRARLTQVMEGWQKVFGKDDSAAVAICSAPGRTELGGNHTDHQRGKVLTGSVDLDALACVAPNGTNTVNLYSEGYGLTSVDLSVLSPDTAEYNSTRALIRGVAAGVARRGYSVAGFDAYLISDVPGGSGLSSSACIEVLLGTVVNELFCANALDSAAIARIGQYAENVYFGKPSGLLDQMGCAMGGIVAVDFFDKDNPKVTPVSFDFAKAGHALCIVDSGANHANLTDDYAAIPVEMKAVAGVFGKEVLSEVAEDAFYRAIPVLRADVGDRAVLRAIHYYSDCRRVEQMMAALDAGDFNEFLRLVSDSGRSSYMYLQNVDTYRDSRYQPVAVALAAAEHCLNGRGAYRVHGGGFAGTIQAFVPVDMAEQFKADMDHLLGRDACHVTYIRPVGGCTIAG